MNKNPCRQENMNEIMSSVFNVNHKPKEEEISNSERVRREIFEE